MWLLFFSSFWGHDTECDGDRTFCLQLFLWVTVGDNCLLAEASDPALVLLVLGTGTESQGQIAQQLLRLVVGLDPLRVGPGSGFIVFFFGEGRVGLY